MNIIIKTPNYIGDTIMMLPALFLLQDSYKEAKFTVVCKPYFEQLFRGLDIHHFIIDNTRETKRVSRSISLIKAIRQESYDLGVLFHNALSSALFFKLAKIDKIIGYNHDARGFLLTYAPKINRSRHYINHYANLVNNYLEKPYKKLPPVKLHSKKQTYFKKSSSPTIALVLGSDKGARGYPRDLSQSLARLLANIPYQILLLGDNNDIPSNALYADAIPSAINLTGKTDISGFIDIIADVDLLVTIDTSALHIAAATNTNFVALLGQGTSAFSVIKPKVSFGSYLFRGEDCLIDSDQIRMISPQMILSEIEKRLHT
ncbi:MAG TPA: glycosyltransferase family 9 protein [Sulfurospirillum arcachonense]|nr:glycosyltransferase family 9 protein [Sulfurospirillum arcachonense]